MRELLVVVDYHFRTRKKEEEAMLHELTTFDRSTDLDENGNNGNHGHKLKVFNFDYIMIGKLIDGQEIAVKRLSRGSGQGLVEFKNEIRLISNLQHMNIIRLIGCSISGEERILIYEFMPNKSLDFFLSDARCKKLLDWKKRYNIIEGIAQGLLYLHKYSRLKIIHRDLKAKFLGQMQLKQIQKGLLGQLVTCHPNMPGMVFSQ
uniref:non-specific serine/threonine protein kinase n=1 Tax=Vitis vinifera TaxID=29760 RepID=F6HCM1_VITVI